MIGVGATDCAGAEPTEFPTQIISLPNESGIGMVIDAKVVTPPSNVRIHITPWNSSLVHKRRRYI
jgi:hypothetical protein